MNRRNFIKATSLLYLHFHYRYLKNNENQNPVEKLFVYGGEFDRGFIKYVASLTGKKNPKIYFLPQQQAMLPDMLWDMVEHCAGLPYCPLFNARLSLHTILKQSFRRCIYQYGFHFSGGAMARHWIWWQSGRHKAWTLPSKKAYENGGLGGGSAGSLCWFEQRHWQIRPGKLTTVEGLGLYSGSHSPHYDGEGERKPLYMSKIKSGEYKSGYACDDKAGIYFENEEVKQVVSFDQKKVMHILWVWQEERLKKPYFKKVLPAPAVEKNSDSNRQDNKPNRSQRLSVMSEKWKYSAIFIFTFPFLISKSATYMKILKILAFTCKSS